MSERTAGFALDAMLAHNPNDEEFGFEMLALMEAVDFEYERWCRVMDLDPDEPASLMAYENVFYAYPEVWTELGEKAFHARITEAVAKWVHMLADKTVLRAKPLRLPR
jgi:hypothetical protein